MRAIARLILTTTFCLTTAAFAARDVPTITVSKGDRISVDAAGLSGAAGPPATPTSDKDRTRAGQATPPGRAPTALVVPGRDVWRAGLHGASDSPAAGPRRLPPVVRRQCPAGVSGTTRRR